MGAQDLLVHHRMGGLHRTHITIFKHPVFWRLVLTPVLAPSLRIPISRRCESARRTMKTMLALLVALALAVEVACAQDEVSAGVYEIVGAPVASCPKRITVRTSGLQIGAGDMSFDDVTCLGSQIAFSDAAGTVEKLDQFIDMLLFGSVTGADVKCAPFRLVVGGRIMFIRLKQKLPPILVDAVQLGNIALSTDVEPDIDHIYLVFQDDTACVWRLNDELQITTRTPAPSVTLRASVRPMLPSPSARAARRKTPKPSPSAAPSVAAVAEPEPIEETVEPSVSLDADGDGTDTSSASSNNECFPAHASVALRDGSRKHMYELEIGDQVQTGPHDYSPIFAWTHRATLVRARFLRVWHERSHTPLVVTAGHFVYKTDGALVVASDLAVGDAVVWRNGVGSTIVKVDQAWYTGLYNPQTVHGDIVVDGVVASTYTKAVKAGTAHALLAPIRAVYMAYVTIRDGRCAGGLRADIGRCHMSCI